ncbi:hypothetical protein LTR15_006431 [Elasticomyces elasticus]|nr:hypothetical protein LTR15_006431 [Elasticomyces elasticus]
MPLRRELGRDDISAGVPSSDTSGDAAATNQHNYNEDLDMIIVGAGFAGIWLLNRLRQRGFKAKIVEVKTCSSAILLWSALMKKARPDLTWAASGTGARVDSQYPVYALSIPEIYEDWTWSSHYPDHTELREYFKHVDDRLNIKKDCAFNAKVTDAVWDDVECMWTISCDSGQKFRTRFWT